MLFFFKSEIRFISWYTKKNTIHFLIKMSLISKNHFWYKKKFDLFILENDFLTSEIQTDSLVSQIVFSDIKHKNKMVN